MSEAILDTDHPQALPVRLLTPAGWNGGEGLDQESRLAAAQAAFGARTGELAVLRDVGGAPKGALFGLGETPGSTQAFRSLAARLPPGDWRLEGDLPAPGEDIALAWAQGIWRFDRYRRSRSEGAARLVTPAGVRPERVRALAHACALAREMIETPANDMGPLQMETIAREIAHHYGASIEVVVGDDLPEAGYPAVHAVGRAAAPHRAPRMIEIAWGDPAAPRVAVVGKGVAFDTGGLDIKPSAGMRLMKKDMGGAAHALALGRMIMAAGLPVRLAVLVPAVENAISGDAMRPGDVLASRKGLSIEVGNTDAEGRLILADALARAAELEPALTIDMATLTGAARVALGPQVVPFYTADETLAQDLAAASQAAEDPLWRLPLWAPYEGAIDSEIADLKNDPDGWAQAGSITAALFLQRFAPASGWIHLDIFGWNPRSRPGYPVGAEAQAIRALFRMIEGRFG